MPSFDKRIYNFSAGPSCLPEAALKQAAQEMLQFEGSGMSVMEMSHRSPAFEGILERAILAVRNALEIPEDFHILFLQGGASTQFAAVPMNLLGAGGTAAFVHTGNWSKKAIAEARRYGDVSLVASSEAQSFTTFPDLQNLSLPQQTAYLHLTTNNTIYGTRLAQFPQRIGQVPVVADMSSNVASQRYDWDRVDLAYAGAQKNLGCAGLTLVIIRKGLKLKPLDALPTMLNYQTHIKSNSLYNTPPCFAIYINMLVMEWLLQAGGIQTMEVLNRQKAEALYAYLDGSDFYRATVQPGPHRSWMNIPFRLPEPAQEKTFLQEAEAAGLVNLKGHRSVGGCRASLYNAMPMEGVQALLTFMETFRTKTVGS